MDLFISRTSLAGGGGTVVHDFESTDCSGPTLFWNNWGDETLETVVSQMREDARGCLNERTSTLSWTTAVSPYVRVKPLRISS